MKRFTTPAAALAAIGAVFVTAFASPASASASAATPASVVASHVAPATVPVVTTPNTTLPPASGGPSVSTTFGYTGQAMSINCKLILSGNSCSSGGAYNHIPVVNGYFWNVMNVPSYTVYSGYLLYGHTGLPSQRVAWWGHKQPLLRSFNGTLYHFVVGGLAIQTSSSQVVGTSVGTFKAVVRYLDSTGLHQSLWRYVGGQYVRVAFRGNSCGKFVPIESPALAYSKTRSASIIAGKGFRDYGAGHRYSWNGSRAPLFLLYGGNNHAMNPGVVYLHCTVPSTTSVVTASVASRALPHRTCTTPYLNVEIDWVGTGETVWRYSGCYKHACRITVCGHIISDPATTTLQLMKYSNETVSVRRSWKMYSCNQLNYAWHYAGRPIAEHIRYNGQVCDVRTVRVKLHWA